MTLLPSTIQQLQELDEQQKKQLLGLQNLSQVEQLYSLHAIRIFKERYLLKDNDGNTVERLDELFRRVAVAAGIIEALYDSRWYSKDGMAKDVDINLEFYKKVLIETQKENMNIDYKYLLNHPRNIKIGDFVVNPFHREVLLSRYIELLEEGKIHGSFHYILDSIRSEGSTRYLPLIERFYELMVNGIFLPNTPCLMNAGTKLGQNAACFTLRMEDSIEGIYKTYADVARIFKSGGGIGINYSELRPEGAFVKSTGGKSSGTLSWLKGTDETTGRVSQGGKRRGASMGILNIDHPEIEKFITLKDNKTLHNHNISVCADDMFFKKFLEKDEYTGKLMSSITNNVWKTGDPGMVFLENMNSNNLLLPVFKKPIDVTNPCSEISMYPYDSCILASINLSKFISPEDNRFDLEEFINVSRTVTQFLDNIVDATKYPIPEINEMTKNCRRIGVGYMGLADALSQLGIKYNSEDGFAFCEFITAIMTVATLLESNRQAGIKGPFPLYNHKDYEINRNKLPINALVKEGNNSFINILHDNIDKFISYRFTDNTNAINIVEVAIDILKSNDRGLRNCSTTTVAPTGTLSMLVDCSSGIEPHYALGFTKKVTIGEFEYINKHLKHILNENGIYSKELIEKIIREHKGSIHSIAEIPDSIKDIFPTAMDIHPFDHVMMQAMAQKWITNGISKTINAPFDISPKMIEQCYVLAWHLGTKGCTIYREGCKDVQVMNSTGKDISINDLNTSDYTRKFIEEMELPLEYKKGLLVIEKDDDYYGHLGMVSEPTNDGTGPVFQQCTNCNAINSMMPNGGKSCYICTSCGEHLGTCM